MLPRRPAALPRPAGPQDSRGGRGRNGRPRKDSEPQTEVPG